MVSPLFDGAKPMLELMMARSISPMSFFSHGVIAIVRASGVVTVAQLFEKLQCSPDGHTMYTVVPDGRKTVL